MDSCNDGCKLSAQFSGISSIRGWSRNMACTRVANRRGLFSEQFSSRKSLLFFTSRRAVFKPRVTGIWGADRRLSPITKIFHADMEITKICFPTESAAQWQLAWSTVNPPYISTLYNNYFLTILYNSYTIIGCRKHIHEWYQADWYPYDLRSILLHVQNADCREEYIID